MYLRAQIEAIMTKLDDILTNLLTGAFVPMVLLFLFLCNVILWTTFKLLVLLFFVIFVLFPLIYKYSYTLQQKALFLNFINLPNQPYDKPELYGLDRTRNFYVYNDNVKLGVWHILPNNVTTLGNDANSFEEALSNGQDVIIYNHGNGGSRGTAHRVELYKVLRRHFHVIAYDYRSYGDSDNVQANEETVVSDCIFMLKWVANRTRNLSNIFVWGHSLGTSISTRSLRILQEEEDFHPGGLFLECPFNNMREEIYEFPLASLFRSVPWFTYTVVEPMQENNFKFQTDVHIKYVDIPIVILHAQDDIVVPLKLGVKLYETAIANRVPRQGDVEMITFDASHNYGHKYIYKAPELPKIIELFVKKSKKFHHELLKQ